MLVLLKCKQNSSYLPGGAQLSPFGTDHLVHVSLELPRPVEESLCLVQDLVIRSSRRLVDQRLLRLQVGDVVCLDGLLDDPLAAFAGGLLLRQVEVVPDALVHAVGLDLLHQVVGAPAEQPQQAAGQEHLWMEQI